MAHSSSPWDCKSGPKREERRPYSRIDAECREQKAGHGTDELRYRETAWPVSDALPVHDLRVVIFLNRDKYTEMLLSVLSVP